MNDNKLSHLQNLYHFLTVLMPLKKCVFYMKFPHLKKSLTQFITGYPIGFAYLSSQHICFYPLELQKFSCLLPLFLDHTDLLSYFWPQPWIFSLLKISETEVSYCLHKSHISWSPFPIRCYIRLRNEGGRPDLSLLYVFLKLYQSVFHVHSTDITR